jgi:DNA polymerase III subunit delta'
MGFDQFLGNERIVTSLRGMLSTERVPSAIAFLGPRGIGKYTLARMFAAAANCERMRDDFCGECDTCKRIALLAEPAQLVERGLAERGESGDADKVPLILQTHPDVWAIVPDPMRLNSPVVRPVLHMGQLRAVERAARFRPGARRRVFIVDGADTMRWDIANIFLKILEEAPDTTTIIMLAQSKNQLLPTVVSRCVPFEFAPVQSEQMESLLKAHTKLDAPSRARAAEMAEGSPGAAIGMDVEKMFDIRKQALKLLQLAATEKSSLLFGLTNQMTKKDAIPFENLLDALYSVLADLLELTSRNSATGTESSTMRDEIHRKSASGDRKSASGTEDIRILLRNPGLKRELQELAALVSTEWVAKAVRGVDTLASGQRRNINRQLALDSLGLSLAAR